MSLHPSLRTKPSGLNQFRTVLKRSERIAMLADRGDFSEDDSPLGLVKVGQRRLVTKKKKKVEEAGDEAAASSDDS
ncbi:MAG: small basic protein [Phycisphaerae bacterium]|nr:small basic protein [Phycisphaerae bacterium]|tara:strand:- start:210 stop:437 length:228 start_codon:yes stop_codon:yes gene_type:complete